MLPRLPLILALPVLFAGGVTAVAGQAAPLTLELRGGAAAPLGAFARGDGPGENVDRGVSFRVDLALSGGGRAAWTVGFSQVRFDCEPAGCPAGGRYVATGMQGGVRLNVVTTGDVIPWVSVGARTARTEVEESPGVAAGVSRLGFGGEVGMGVYVGMFRAVAFNPAVRWGGVNTRLPGGALLHMRFWVLDFGVALAF